MSTPRLSSLCLAGGLLAGCGQMTGSGPTSLAPHEDLFSPMVIAGEDAVSFAGLLKSSGASTDQATAATTAEGLKCQVVVTTVVTQSCTTLGGPSPQVVRGARAARMLSLLVKYRVFHRSSVQGGGTAVLKDIICSELETARCTFAAQNS